MGAYSLALHWLNSNECGPDPTFRVNSDPDLKNLVFELLHVFFLVTNVRPIHSIDLKIRKCKFMLTTSLSTVCPKLYIFLG